MRLVDAAIRRDDYYQAFFPRGSRLQLFYADARPDGLTTFQDYVLRLHRLRSPFRSDGTVAMDADLHPSTWLHEESTIRRHLVPAFGPLSLWEVDVARVNEFRRRLIASGLSGKSVTNIIGMLHKVMTDATEEGLIISNPVLRIRSGRRRRAAARIRSQSDPLTPAEIAAFLATVAGTYRTLYDVWFRVGWRSSEIVGLRFRNLDFPRQIITVDTGRLPRFGGIEAEPKTGPRRVDCSYDQEILALLMKLRDDRGQPGPNDSVFTHPAGQPLSQEWRPQRRNRRSKRSENGCLIEWTRSQPIRTAGEVPLRVPLLRSATPFAYQRVAARAVTLHRLGMSVLAIARDVGVSDKTVAKAIRWARSDT
jgi:integrase